MLLQENEKEHSIATFVYRSDAIGYAFLEFQQQLTSCDYDFNPAKYFQSTKYSPSILI